MTDVEKLYEMLKQTQESRGFFFNNDKDWVFELLESLVTNSERYGYMCCPCRLSSGDREKDRDIICPCEYRVPDIEEFGSCYCKLYVSTDWNEGKIEHVYVPERRPDEKFSF